MRRQSGQQAATDPKTDRTSTPAPRHRADLAVRNSIGSRAKKSKRTQECEQTNLRDLSKIHSESTRKDVGREQGLRGRGGSVKIKSQGWIINRTLRGSFSAVSTPNFASKYSLE